jgi:hypothetical protein
MADTNTKPGYKTPAFWLTVAVTAVAALTGSGAVDSGSAASVVALVASVLGAAGYTAWRTFAKSDDATKPAWKTTEFWGAVASVVVSGLYASGVFAVDSTGEKVLALVATILGALGYAVTRKK